MVDDSQGLRALCKGPKTPTQWKFESISNQRTDRGRCWRYLCIQKHRSVEIREAFSSSTVSLLNKEKNHKVVWNGLEWCWMVWHDLVWYGIAWHCTMYRLRRAKLSLLGAAGWSLSDSSLSLPPVFNHSWKSPRNSSWRSLRPKELKLKKLKSKKLKCFRLNQTYWSFPLPPLSHWSWTTLGKVTFKANGHGCQKHRQYKLVSWFPIFEPLFTCSWPKVFNSVDICRSTQHLMHLQSKIVSWFPIFTWPKVFNSVDMCRSTQHLMHLQSKNFLGFQFSPGPKFPTLICRSTQRQTGP